MLLVLLWYIWMWYWHCQRVSWVPVSGMHQGCCSETVKFLERPFQTGLLVQHLPTKQITVSYSLFTGRLRVSSAFLQARPVADSDTHLRWILQNIFESQSCGCVPSSLKRGRPRLKYNGMYNKACVSVATAINPAEARQTRSPTARCSRQICQSKASSEFVSSTLSPRQSPQSDGSPPLLQPTSSYIH